MYLIGGLLIWLAVKKEYEPALLLPMGFGAIMVNLPLSGVINQVTEGIGETQGIIQWLFETTISASEALPILLFIGIGAMIDFGPLLSQPIMFLFGAAAQFGIFFAICKMCIRDSPCFGQDRDSRAVKEISRHIPGTQRVLCVPGRHPHDTASALHRIFNRIWIESSDWPV